MNGVDARAHERRVAVAVIALAMVVGTAPRAWAGAAEIFTVPPALQPQVDFWANVFATWGKHQVVIHDTERLDRVYRVLDFRDLERDGLSDVQIELAIAQQEEAEKARIRSVLLHLDQAGSQGEYLTDEERRIAALFADEQSPSKFADAASPDRIRSQRGLRERFAQGVQVGNAYFPHMEAIFREEGVPPEITRLPLVESCFNMHAYSKAGAAGVWQFMPTTARSFMRVDGIVDERLDPLVATRAAARFMRQNYEKLGSWPLAINAYNHGPAGMARAVSTTGTTDIATIIRTYRGPAFKFASRNFYPEFLAALQVERHHRHYFGDLPLQPPLTVDTVYLEQRTSIDAAARCAGTRAWELADLNPSLLPPVHSGRAPIPAGFGLRLPAGRADRFRRCAAYQPQPELQQASRAPAGRAAKESARSRRTEHVVHKVRPGQTLSQIAAQYGSTVEAIRRRNRLKGTTIHSGQVLRIPTS
jgi:peptidoglycan lytic transglycosylase D